MRAKRDSARALLGPSLAAALAGAIGATVLPATTHAADYKITLRTGARLEAEVNRALDPNGGEGSVSGSATAGVTMSAETKRGGVVANFGGSARARINADGELDSEIDFDPNLSVSATRRGKTTALNAAGDFRIRQVDAEQVEDTGVINETARQITAGARFSATEDIDARTALEGSFSVRMVDFTRNVASLTPSRTFSGTVNLSRAVTETTSAGARIALRRFFADNAEGDRSDTLDLGVDLTHQRTSRHTISASAGVTLVRTVERNTDAPASTDIGFTGRLGLNYRLKDLALRVNLTQDIEPSAVGALQTFTRLGFSLSHDINGRESLSFAASAARRAPVSGGGETRDTLSAGPSYSLRLDQETQLSLGYVFRLSRESDEGVATGHQVFLGVSREFPILE